MPSETTPKLNLPLIAAQQAQKHVTHNEALRDLDVLVQAAVKDRDLTAPPATPEEGECYIVAATATGDWAGHEGEIAEFRNGGWVFHSPQEGWRVWVADEDALLIHDGATWKIFESGITSVNPVPGDKLGVNTSADDTNRLAVKSDAVLFSHDDVTPGSGNVRFTVNKAAASKTASLLFQDNFSGRAELGLAGDDDFHLKVSNDGGTWWEALHVDAATGLVDFPAGPPSGLAPEAFGSGAVANTDYVNARGTSLFTNGTGALGNTYNWSSEFVFDPVTTPGLPGAMRHDGHEKWIFSEEKIAIDPARVYRQSCYLRQKGVPGDWSAYASGDRFPQYIGLAFFDVDGLAISSQYHMVFYNGAKSSRTTLTQPLSPGDTVIHVADASGWNDNVTTHPARTGVIIFGYRNSRGYRYTHYSRIVEFGLFDPATAVDVSAGTITLSSPLPASMGNPDDPSGTWPVGTPIANSNAGSAYKYVAASSFKVPATDRWYVVEGYIGGVDRSGRNISWNFPPGSAFCKALWIMNYRNRAGGSAGYPDIPSSSVWVAGMDLKDVPLAHMEPAADGSVALKVPVPDPVSDTVVLSTTTRRYREV